MPKWPNFAESGHTGAHLTFVQPQLTPDVLFNLNYAFHYPSSDPRPHSGIKGKRGQKLHFISIRRPSLRRCVTKTPPLSSSTTAPACAKPDSPVTTHPVPYSRPSLVDPVIRLTKSSRKRGRGWPIKNILFCPYLTAIYQEYFCNEYTSSHQ